MLHKILVFGAGGLLGHHLCTLYKLKGLTHEECDITDGTDVILALQHNLPEIVINCAGITPRVESSPVEQMRVNAYGPQLLRACCDSVGARLIQISTNCVFPGVSGKYDESMYPSPTDNYGLSKALGEVDLAPHTTIRTSLIGLPDPKGRGLLAWFTRQKRALGFDQVKFNGVTATELAHILMHEIIPRQRESIVHIHSPNTVTKYDLLVMTNEIYGLDIKVTKQSEVMEPVVQDLTLTSNFDYGVSTKPIRIQIEEMKAAWEGMNENL